LIAIFDTSALFDDLSMRGVQSRQLLRWAGHGSYELHLPEVVVAEMTNDARERIEKACAKAGAAGESLAKLGVGVELPVPEVSALAAQFEAQLRGAITEAGGQVLPLPDVSHAELVERSARGIKPFSSPAKEKKEQSDRGYRDSLIWVTALNAARSDKVTLVTENTSDFTDGGGNLHPDLLADLEHEGLVGELEVCLSLTLFLNAYLPSDAPALEEFRLRAAGNDEFRDELETRVSKLLATPQDWARSHVDFVRLSDPSRIGDYGPETTDISITRLVSIETLNAYGFDETDVDDDAGVIQLETKAELDVDLVFDRSDAEWIAEYGADVELYDWEETFVAGHIAVSVVARIDLVFDRATGEIAELEVIDLRDLPDGESV
jgi:hypothetical protein